MSVQSSNYPAQQSNYGPAQQSQAQSSSYGPQQQQQQQQQYYTGYGIREDGSYGTKQLTHPPVNDFWFAEGTLPMYCAMGEFVIVFAYLTTFRCESSTSVQHSV